MIAFPTVVGAMAHRRGRRASVVGEEFFAALEERLLFIALSP